jgi:putative transcriptional regulator
MSEPNIIRARKLPDGTVVQVFPDGSIGPLADRTDWARLDAMTEEEIEANALADEDNPPITAEELARMKPVPNPKRIRERLHLTQEEFSEQFRLPLGTLRDWEQGKKQPDSAARTLLRVIEFNPEVVIQALER